MTITTATNRSARPLPAVVIRGNEVPTGRYLWDVPERVADAGGGGGPLRREAR